MKSLAYLAMASLLGLQLIACKEPASTHERKVLGPIGGSTAEDGDATPAAGDNQTPTGGGSPQAFNGVALYQEHCESCHGALADLNKEPNNALKTGLIGKDGMAIAAAVASVPDMAGLADLKDAQKVFDAIGVELKKITPPPPAAPVDNGNANGQIQNGLQLYTANCQNCHGAKAATTVNGRTFELYQAALVNIPAMQNNATLSGLNRGQVESIMAYLSAP